MEIEFDMQDSLDKLKIEHYDFEKLANDLVIVTKVHINLLKDCRKENKGLHSLICFQEKRIEELKQQINEIQNCGYYSQRR